jgi:hypothetical protein
MNKAVERGKTNSNTQKEVKPGQILKTLLKNILEKMRLRRERSVLGGA